MKFTEFSQLYPEIHCDEAGLKHHLIQKLSYNEDSAERVVEQLTDLLKPLNNTSRRDYFWKEATKEGTSTDVVNVILQSIEHSQLIYMLKYQDWDAYTALHRCAANKRSDVIQLILHCCVSEDECYQRLRFTNLLGQTPLTMSCREGDSESVRVILNHINQDMLYSLLQIGDTLSNTPLNEASYEGHTEVMKIIHESITQTQWINLLQINGYKELPVLQTAAYWVNKPV